MSKEKRGISLEIEIEGRGKVILYWRSEIQEVWKKDGPVAPSPREEGKKRRGGKWEKRRKEKDDDCL